jgi:integrase
MVSEDKNLTLAEYLEEYALTRGLGAGTHHQYRVAVELFERWRAEHGRPPARLAELEELELSAWLRDYAASGRAPATVRSKRVLVVGLWRAAADDGYVDPPRRRIRSVRVVLDAPTSWTRDEVARLVLGCRRLPRRHRSGLTRAMWWELAVRVAWDSGLRWGDLVALRVDQVTPEGFAAFPQRKTGRVVICRLAPSTMALLRRSLELCPRRLVCPWPVSRESFNAQVRLLVKKSGIRGGTWRWLRRAGATDVELQEPGGAPRHLGHAPGSGRMAYQHYVDPRIIAAAGRVAFPRELDAGDGQGQVDDGPDGLGQAGVGAELLTELDEDQAGEQLVERG